MILHHFQHIQQVIKSKQNLFRSYRNVYYKNKIVLVLLFCNGLFKTALNMFKIKNEDSRTTSRSTSSQMFFKVRVLKDLANFIGKYQCQSLFLIKDTPTQVFSYVISKILAPQHLLCLYMVFKIHSCTFISSFDLGFIIVTLSKYLPVE